MTLRHPQPTPGGDDEVKVEELPEISVTLLGSTRLFKRVDRPAGVHSAAGGAIDLLQPLRLTIHLPDGRPIALVARSMSLNSRHGIVGSVYVRRPLEPVRFGEAVADLRRTLEELGLEVSERSRQQMTAWPDDAPGFGEGVIPYDFKAANHSAFDGGGFDIRVSPDPQGGWYYLIMFGTSYEASMAAQAAGRLAVLPADSPYEVRFLDQGETEPELEESDHLPEVSVPLLGSFRDVEAIELRPTLPEIRLTARDLLRPHRLTLRLPDSRSAVLDVGAMTFLCHYGVIEDVYLRRPMKPVAYAEAVADLRRTMEAIGIAPDEAMKRQMAAWPEDAPGADEVAAPLSFEAETAVSDDVGLRVRIGPDPQGGWYSLLLFEATAEAKQAAQAAAGTPDAKLAKPE